MINTPARLLLHVPFFCLKKNLISTFEIEKKSFAEKPHRTIFFFQVGLYFGRLLVCLLTWRKKKQLPPCNYDNFCWRPQSRDPPILSLYFSLRVFQCLHTSIGALGPEVVRWPDRHIGGERAKGASRFSLLFFPIDISVGPKQNCQFSSCLNCAPPLPRPHHLVPVRCCCCRLARLFFRLLAQRYRDAQTTQT